MVTITASKAKDKLYKLMEQTVKSHEPVVITGKRNNVIMVSEDDWKAIEETFYLNSKPGLAEELVKRMNDNDSEFITEKEISW